MADPYELDPDVAVLRRKSASMQIPTKSPLYGKNPQLQPEAEYDYNSDPDVAVLANRKAKPAETETSGFLPSWLKTGAETALGAVSGVVTPIVGGAYGIAKSIPEAIQTGQAPAPIAQRYAEQFIRQRPGFTVTDPQAQANLQAIQQAFEASKLPPVFPEAQGFGIKPGEAMTTKVPVKTAVNAQDALTQQFAQKVGQGAEAAKQVFQKNKPTVRIEPTAQSGGAAAAMPENVLRGNIEAAVANASPELQAHVAQQNPRAIDLPALETRALEEKHGINLTRGQRVGDTQLYSQEWNKRGETETLGRHFEEQPAQFSSAFENAKQRHAPDIPATADASELGQIQINALEAKDLARRQAISQAYKALEDANAGQFPIDVSQLKTNIETALKQKLKGRYVPNEVQAELNDIYKKGSMSFEEFEALRTLLAEEMRSNSNGNARGASYIVRQALEDLPMPENLAGVKELADTARSLVRQRAEVIKSNPAYRAAVKEAADAAEASSQGESLNAAKFHKKFIAGATPEAIRRLKAEIADDNLAQQAITFSELDRAKSAAINPSERNLTPEQFAKFIKQNKSVLRESLSPEAMQDVMELGALSSKVGMPKTGTFNYSNTFSSMLGDLAKEGLSGAAEAKLAVLTKGASIPAVSLGRQMLQKMNKEGFAREAVNPYGGLTKE